MAQPLTLRASEHKQLRAPGEVQRWTSDAPKVATVTDEDVVIGRSGGLVTAVAPGRACIRAIGYGGETLVELDLTVASPAAVTVAVGQTAPLEGSAGRVRNVLPHIADVTSAGQIRGLSPGITLLRGDGSAGSVETQVRVTGALEIEVNQSRDLAGQFAVPVRSWRAASSAATINGEGTVTAGDRPRSVPITAVLEDGSEFSFDLRIIRNTAVSIPDARPIATPSPVARPAARPPESVPPLVTSTRSAPQPSEPLPTSKRQEVQTHLAQAKLLMDGRLWSQAGAELAAANVAASGDAELEELVRVERLRLVEVRLHEFAAIFGQAAAALARKDYAGATQLLRDVLAPHEEMVVVAELRGLARLLEQAEASEGPTDAHPAQIHRALTNAWLAARRIRLHEVMKVVAVLASQWNAGEFVETLIDFLASPEVAEVPSEARTGLEASLQEFGDAAFETLLKRLATITYDAGTGSWLLGVLVVLAPVSRAGVLVPFYAAQPPANQERLIAWFCQLLKPAAGTLFELMAGVLKRMPLSPQVAKAIQARIGIKQLEDYAIKWAARNHKGAQIVLERLYGYSSSSFRKR